MEVIAGFVKSYFVFLLILQIIAYLTPKESYKKYVQFFTGALMAVLLLKPVLTWMDKDMTLPETVSFEELSEQLDNIAYEGEGEDMFEIFFVEESTEKTKQYESHRLADCAPVWNFAVSYRNTFEWGRTGKKQLSGSGKNGTDSRTRGGK